MTIYLATFAPFFRELHSTFYPQGALLASWTATPICSIQEASRLTEDGGKYGILHWKAPVGKAILCCSLKAYSVKASSVSNKVTFTFIIWF